MSVVSLWKNTTPKILFQDEWLFNGCRQTAGTPIGNERFLKKESISIRLRIAEWVSTRKVVGSRVSAKPTITNRVVGIGFNGENEGSVHFSSFEYTGSTTRNVDSDFTISANHNVRYVNGKTSGRRSIGGRTGGLTKNYARRANKKHKQEIFHRKRFKGFKNSKAMQILFFFLN